MFLLYHQTKITFNKYNICILISIHTSLKITNISSGSRLVNQFKNPIVDFLNEIKNDAPLYSIFNYIYIYIYF